MRATLPAIFRALLIPIFLTAATACRPGGITSITPAALRSHAGYLASDELAGRMTGTDGIGRAEQYIADAFSRFGLQPLPGDDDHFIDFSLYHKGYDSTGTFTDITVQGQTYHGEAGVGVKPFFFSGEGEHEAELIFVGYGITASEYAYDDYEGLDVKGKLVLMLRHEPNNDDPDSSFKGTSFTRHAYFVTKAKNALAHGAAGMILFTDPLWQAGVDDLRLGGRYYLDPGGEASKSGESSGSRNGIDPAFLAVHISRGLARAVFEAHGMTPAGLQRTIDRGVKPKDLLLAKASARVSVRTMTEARRLRASNVAGFIEGRDPVKRHEWIVIGGHHDHLGSFSGEGDTIFNGADDNASGVSGVLELAEAFARYTFRPRRSLLFLTFSAEEVGLLGSRALLEQRMLPVDKIKLMLNLDMIGRNPDDPVRVYTSGEAGAVRSKTEQMAQELELPLVFDRYYGSDQAMSDSDPFFRQGIPTFFFYTGSHADYHQTGDHADLLGYEKMAKIVRLSYGLLHYAAEVDVLE